MRGAVEGLASRAVDLVAVSPEQMLWPRMRGLAGALGDVQQGSQPADFQD